MDDKILKIEEIAYDELTYATVGIHILEEGTHYIATKFDDSGRMPFKRYLKNLTDNDIEKLKPYMDKTANLYIYESYENYQQNQKLSGPNNQKTKHKIKLNKDYID